MAQGGRHRDLVENAAGTGQSHQARQVARPELDRGVPLRAELGRRTGFRRGDQPALSPQESGLQVRAQHEVERRSLGVGVARGVVGIGAAVGRKGDRSTTVARLEGRADREGGAVQAQCEVRHRKRWQPEFGTRRKAHALATELLAQQGRQALQILRADEYRRLGGEPCQSDRPHVGRDRGEDPARSPPHPGPGTGEQHGVGEGDRVVPRRRHLLLGFRDRNPDGFENQGHALGVLLAGRDADEREKFLGRDRAALRGEASPRRLDAPALLFHFVAARCDDRVVPHLVALGRSQPQGRPQGEGSEAESLRAGRVEEGDAGIACALEEDGRGGTPCDEVPIGTRGRATEGLEDAPFVRGKPARF